MKKLVLDEHIPLKTALCLLTANPAAVLGIEGLKGCIAPGADADLLVFNDKLDIEGVFARGRVAMWNKEVLLKGRFEE